MRWLKDVGDQVEVGDELVEVETDKATVIYEAEIAGRLSEILVPAGRGAAAGRADRAARRHRGRRAGARGAAARARPSGAPAGRSPRPSRAAARASWASTSGRYAAPGRAGASASPTSRRGRTAARRPQPPPAAPDPRRPRARPGRWPRRRRAPAAHLDAAPDRAAHGRDDRDRAALPALRRRRLRRDPAPAQATARGRRRRGADGQRHRRRAHGARAARASGGQQQLRRRRHRALRARQRRHRRGAAGRAARPRRARRRPPLAGRDRARDGRAGRARAHVVVDARRPGRRDVHRLEPRHVRHQRVRLHHQRPRGGDPLGRRGPAARARRRGRRSHVAPVRDTHPRVRPPRGLRCGWGRVSRRACRRFSNLRRFSFCEHDQRSDRGRVPRRRPRCARRGAGARRERDPLRRGHRRRRRRLRDDARALPRSTARSASSTPRSRSSR